MGVAIKNIKKTLKRQLDTSYIAHHIFPPPVKNPFSIFCSKSELSDGGVEHEKQEVEIFSNDLAIPHSHVRLVNIRFVNFGGQFHKPIYALRQAFTLCPILLRLKKASQKLGAECKSLAQSVNGFMKSTPGSRSTKPSLSPALTEILTLL